MGTRHLIFVWYKGKFHIAQYGQWDGYPEGQGIKIVRFLTKTVDHTAPGEAHQEPHALSSDASKDNIAALKTALDNDLLYTPTAEQPKKFDADAEVVRKEANELMNRVNSGLVDVTTAYVAFGREYDLLDTCAGPLMVVCPSMSRDCGAQILSLVAYATEKVPIRLQPEFIVDWLFCEWAYVVDLDNEVLEVYKGKRARDEGNKGRFDDEDYVKELDDVPNLIAKYESEALRSLDVKKFVDGVNAVWKT